VELTLTTFLPFSSVNGYWVPPMFRVAVFVTDTVLVMDSDAYSAWSVSPPG
jgi:hypothetical protein